MTGKILGNCAILDKLGEGGMGEVWRARESAWKTIHPSQPVLEIHDLHVTPDGQANACNYVTAQSDLYVAHGLK